MATETRYQRGEQIGIGYATEYGGVGVHVIAWADGTFDRLRDHPTHMAGIETTALPPVDSDLSPVEISVEQTPSLEPILAPEPTLVPPVDAQPSPASETITSSSPVPLVVANEPAIASITPEPLATPPTEPSPPVSEVTIEPVPAIIPDTP